MRYFDYDWDLDSDGITLDEELDVDKLGWKNGDYFELRNINGRIILKKVDPLIAFIRQGAKDVAEQIEVNMDEKYG